MQREKDCNGVRIKSESGVLFIYLWSSHMTRTKRTLLAIASLGALAFTGSAFAGGTTSLALTANVTATCTFDTGTQTMNFGTLDPSVLVPATQTAPINYHCSTGQAASSIKINGNLSPTSVNIINGASTLPVQLTWVTPTTVGAGFGGAVPPITVTINGTIAAADVGTAIAGNYLASYVVALLP